MATTKKSPTKSTPSANQAPTGDSPEMSGKEVPKPEVDGSKSRDDLIREAAYRRWEARGSEHGGHEDDWREAEKEVRPPEGN
jgi:Protein of unknown function (DUF2934)